MVDFNKKKEISERKKNIIESLGISKLDKRITDRLIRSAQANGWCMGEDSNWPTNEGLKLLIRGALDLRAEMSIQGAISLRLDRLIVEWFNCLPDPDR